jgi:uncharacterized repeat protein (TIGR03803 family)
MIRLAAVLFLGAATPFLLLQSPPTCAATETVVYSFCSQANCVDGEAPVAGVFGVNQELYTTSTTGGANTWGGTLVGINRITGAATVVYSFQNYIGDAQDPESGLIRLNGNLLGTAAEGGSGNNGNGADTVYALNPKTGKEKVLYSFCGQTDCADGAWPKAAPIEVNGVFYGTTPFGGGSDTGCYGLFPGCGTVFSFDPATGTEKVVHAFCPYPCGDGSEPHGSLVAVNGTLYGTTLYGGNGNGCDDMGQGCGTVFALDLNTGVETVVHVFAGEAVDGGAPLAGFVNVNGILYGTTEYGGSTATTCGTWDGCGTVFSIDPASGAEKIIHAFRNNGRDGWNPVAALIGRNGKLYGTTENGGAHGYGTVFAIDLATGKERTLYSFCSQQSCSDGANPYAGVTEIHGTLNGTTQDGGASNYGTVFSVKP